MRGFIAELRRRQMFRLVGLYIVGAWVVIQVADIVFPAWGIPESAMRFLFYAALLCFPIALVFGWIFDIRRDGIYRTRAAGPDDTVDARMRWQDYAILVALAGISISILLGSAHRIRVTAETAPAQDRTELFTAVERQANSVAVLPFENLDPNPDTGYFSDGVSDEILSRLANVRDLFVVGRASSFAFRQSDELPASIAAKLGVQYLLAGTVRRDGDLVRITARLVDEKGSHVWSQSFDRQLEKIFTIQSDIADAVAQRVAAEVAVTDGPPAARSTQNREAYDAYLRGRELFHDQTRGWDTDALGLFRTAMELDPGFAPPYAYFAIVAALFGIPEDSLEEVEAATRTALELDADLAEAHVAMGQLYEERDQDLEAAMAAYRRAIERDPTFWIAYNRLAITLQRDGRFSEGREILFEAVERDPLNPLFLLNAAMQFQYIGELERAEKLMLRVLTLPKTPWFAKLGLSALYAERGRIDEAIRWRKKWMQEAAPGQLERLAENGGDPEFLTGRLADSLSDLAREHFILGLNEHADYWMKLAIEITPDDRAKRNRQGQWCRWKGELPCLERELKELEKLIPDIDEEGDWGAWGAWQILIGDAEKGIAYLERRIDTSAIADAKVFLDLDPLAAHYLVLGYRMAAQPEEAERLLGIVGPKLEAVIRSEGFKVAGMSWGLAVNRWLRGNREGAIEAAREAIDMGWIDLYRSRHDPLARELLALPELQEDLAGVEQEIQRQRAIVESAGDTEDFRRQVADWWAELKRLSQVQH
jgi:TolB-like protein/Flp pilus assembly protein TadD